MTRPEANQDVPANLPPVIQAPRKQGAPTLYIIIGFKILKGGVLLLAAIMFFGLVQTNLQHEYTRLLREASLDPQGELFRDFGVWLNNVSPSQIRAVAVGLFLYSIFSLIEGAGLILRAAWAAWLAIGESSLFIPVEIIQLIQKFSFLMVLVLVLNAGVVWYLYANRRRLFYRH
jgi:uncharacterized membrane protein (DUF2068 family)